MTTVQGNTAQGDIAGGSIHKTYNAARERTVMSRLVEQYLSETEADQALSRWTEKLEHFFTNETSGDLRSLEEKLLAAGRANQLQKALRRKQAAWKSIMRIQGSPSAQSIYTFLLADIVVKFEHWVLPLVDAGEPNAVIDAAMIANVIDPAFKLLESNPLLLDAMDIDSLVYFLAGNCHIRWDAC